MIYLLDTNVISDLIIKHQRVQQRVDDQLLKDDQVGLSAPIYFEILRGLLWKKAPQRERILRDKLRPVLDWITLEDEDWLQAAEFWATAVSQGRQLSDVDVLIAAMVYRRNAILVSNDTDFDVLPSQREDWRMP
ncbi:MAG: PIN domain-containing protein [Chloroflexi bacterium]|nr:PIN domain-containing protein [Chloroflexota bacterium]